MNRKPGLYIIVDTLACKTKKRSVDAMSVIGSLVVVTGESEHGACCATLWPASGTIVEYCERVVSKRYGGVTPWRGFSTRWANLRPFKNPDSKAIDERRRELEVES